MISSPRYLRRALSYAHVGAIALFTGASMETDIDTPENEDMVWISFKDPKQDSHVFDYYEYLESLEIPLLS